MREQSQANPTVSLLARQLQRTEIVDLPVKPAVIRSTDQSLLTLSTLPKHKAIVLFTPAIPSSTNFDPFEPLGRAIHSHHQKVRHVPYSLKDGYTYVHEAHLEDGGVGAVVVVIVNGKKVAEQIHFADSVLQKTRHMAEDMPAVKIWVGKGSFRMNGYNYAICCTSHDPDQLRNTATLMFGASGVTDLE
jgi:hypothetical protein